jgi:hypothetical protein
MRVKLQSKATHLEVINAETGELLEGISRLSLLSDPQKGTRLDITLVDFDLDIDMVANLSREELKPTGKP